LGNRDKEALIMKNELTRRSFLGAVAAAAGTSLFPVRIAGAASKHPTPRPGITGEFVLSRKDLQRTPELIPLFDSIRRIPRIADGIKCSCGCSNMSIEFYSLLSCFEKNGMAVNCGTCQKLGRLVVKMHKQSKSLDQIRAAVDADSAESDRVRSSRNPFKT